MEDGGAVEEGEGGGFEEDAVVGFGFEILLALVGSVIFAIILIDFETDIVALVFFVLDESDVFNNADHFVELILRIVHANHKLRSLLHFLIH